MSGSPRTGTAPVRAVSWEVQPCRAGVGRGGLCVVGSGAGRSPSHRGIAGEPRGPAPRPVYRGALVSHSLYSSTSKAASVLPFPGFLVRLTTCRRSGSASGISSSRVCPSVSPHVSTSSRPCLCARCAKQAGDTTGSPLGADRHKWPELSLNLARC